MFTYVSLQIVLRSDAGLSSDAGVRIAEAAKKIRERIEEVAVDVQTLYPEFKISTGSGYRPSEDKG